MRAHPFFKLHKIDWDDVQERKHKPPFVPVLKDENDLSKFPAFFTQEAVTDALTGVGGGEGWDGYSFCGSTTSESSSSSSFCSADNGFDSPSVRRSVDDCVTDLPHQSTGVSGEDIVRDAGESGNAGNAKSELFIKLSVVSFN